MNPKPISETEAIRSDIDMTRRRIDDTIDALGERMKGRHLLDEAIGFFRQSDTSEKTNEAAARVKEKLSAAAGKISESAGSAANAVVDTVKMNPLPILLITAGAAWLAYNATRKRSADLEDEDLTESDRYDPDTHYDRQLAYPGGGPGQAEGPAEGLTDEASSKFAQVKGAVSDKLSSAKDQMKDKFSGLSDATRDTFQSAKERAGEIGDKVQQRTREMYGRTRDKVADTADQHPVEVGLGCLALGVIIGLALPTPEPVHRLAGPTVDRLRNRTREASRDMLKKGKRVVQAATDAAKQEAQSQGLTPERLRQGLSAVGQRAPSDATNAAPQEGMMPSDSPAGMVGNARAGTDPADPSAARPGL